MSLSRKRVFAVGILLAAMLGLSACGQKGDLYHLPEVNQAQQPEFHYHV